MSNFQASKKNFKLSARFENARFIRDFDEIKLNERIDIQSRSRKKISWCFK